MEIGKWQRPSTRDRTPPVRQHWGHFMHFSVSFWVRLTVDVVKKSASTDFILTILSRSIETPKFRFHVQLPRPSDPHTLGNKVCWPQRENVGLWARIKHTRRHRVALTWLGRLGRRLRHLRVSKKMLFINAKRAPLKYSWRGRHRSASTFAVSDNEEVNREQGRRKSSSTHAQRFITLLTTYRLDRLFMQCRQTPIQCLVTF